MSYSPLRRRTPIRQGYAGGDAPHFDDHQFWDKIRRFGMRLGAPVVEKTVTLYCLLKAPTTPYRAKLIIIGALLYFISPLDTIPDLLGPLGFTDDIAVITLVYTQIKSYINDEIRAQAREKTEKLLQRWLGKS